MSDQVSAIQARVRANLGGDRLPVLTLSASVLILLLSNANLDQLCFDRSAITQQGEWWRLVTAHLMHSSVSHLVWDLIAFIGVSAYLERKQPALLIPTWVMGMVSVNLLLLSPLSDLAFYCGLSGVLFAPLTLAVIIYKRSTTGLMGWLPLWVCGAKLIWELLWPRMLFVDTGWSPYPASHVAGVAGGLSVYLGALTVSIISAHNSQLA